jgi:hypothetical protein
MGYSFVRMGDYLQTKWFLHNGVNYEVGQKNNLVHTLKCQKSK